ncbi:hypothetical protein [Escherichia coli]|nr:hypothetical protein [Escherichia coli]
MAINFQTIAAANRSSRRRDHSRRPLTPPYMRLRIRRFMGSQ